MTNWYLFCFTFWTNPTSYLNEYCCSFCHWFASAGIVLEFPSFLPSFDLTFFSSWILDAWRDMAKEVETMNPPFKSSIIIFLFV